MSNSISQFPLPDDLVAPIDDGGCAHLTGLEFPSISLISATAKGTRQPSKNTSGNNLTTVDYNLAEISQDNEGLIILFCYPRTGAPGEIVPEEWNSIPGARGCTPQNCSYRDNFSTLLDLNVSHVFGLSTQSPEVQLELHTRLNLPYDILSDEALKLTEALNLPTFAWKGKKLVKRLTIAIQKGKIVKVWYPIFPSDKNVHDVIAWLTTRKQ